MFLNTVFYLFIVTNGRFVATLCWANLSVPYCQQHLLSSCLSHVLVIPTVFQTFPLSLCVLWCSVISDTTFVIVLGSHKLPRKMTSLINQWCVLTAPPVGHSPICIPLLGPQWGLINATELGQLVTLQQPLRVQVLIKGRVVHLSL